MPLTRSAFTPAAGTAPSRVEFGSFAIDLRREQLVRDGTAVSLRPKTWSVLLYLAGRPGVLVTRDELLDAVWRDVAVTPDTLTKSIGELRTVLGDDARQPRYIETVHRRGFRFLETPRLPMGPDATAPGPGDGGAGLCVGREAELRTITASFQRACDGTRQLVFVSGPAGAGKTTLVETFLHDPLLRDCGALVGSGASTELHGVREAYMPVLEALAATARGHGDATLATALRQVAPSWLAQIPWLAGDDPAVMQRSVLAARAERMLREGVALLEALSRDVPLVLVLDDLHWSDPSTVDLLARIGQRRDHARLLILATYRPADVAVHDHPLGSAVRALRGKRMCVDLPLHELSAAAVHEYLDMRFPGAVPPPALAGALYAHTDGNPFLLRAVVDQLVARGWILDTAPGWSFRAMPDGTDFGVPDDARNLVALQLAGVCPADRQVLEAASAVVGDSASATLLAAALECPLADTETRCDVLAHGQRFLRTIDTHPPRYAFVHELYRQAVYHDIPPGRRRRLHLRIGTAIEDTLGERAAEAAPELAHHFEQGGEFERALRYLMLAAERSRQRAAPREASGYLEHALTLVPRLRDPTERQRRELDVRCVLAARLIERFGPASEALREDCERALTLCDAATDPLVRFEVLYALTHVYSMRGDPERLTPLLATLRDLAEEIGSAAHAIIADTAACRAALYRADYSATCSLAAAVDAAARAASPEVPAFGADPVVATRTHWAVALWMLGHAKRARAVLRTATVPRADPSPFTNASVAVFRCILDMLDGKATDVLRDSETACRLAEEHGFGHWLIMSQALHGWARIRLGEVAAGVEEVARARTAQVDSGAAVFTSYILAFLAEGHLRSGDLNAGLAAAEEGLAIAGRTLDRSYVPELWRLKGELLLAAKRPRDGEAALQQAIDAARTSKARQLGLRATIVLARHWSATGHAPRARSLLETAIRGLGRDVGSADMRQATALLGRAPRRKATRRSATGRAAG